MNRSNLVVLTATLLLVQAAVTTQAQTLYRSVGPDGRVTFSDVPPPPTASIKGRPSGTTAPGEAPTGSGPPLPFELQQIASRYPVTLYTGEACAPCASGRNLLMARGIPFAERTVTTNEDAAALQRLSGDISLPFMTIGAQQIKGYSDTEWTQFLDAAGYPKTSQMPAGYRASAATPMVAAQRPAPSVGASNTPPAPTPASAPAPEPNANPANIRF